MHPEYSEIFFSEFQYLGETAFPPLGYLAISGGVDENFDLYSASDVTVQWSTISRADPDGGHYESGHNYGLINGPDSTRTSIHHNLFIHNSNRNPAIANGPSEIINNVSYNVRHGFIHHNPATGNFNIVGNYFKQGPNDTLIPFFFDDEDNGRGSPALSYYLDDNFVDDSGDLVGSISNHGKHLIRTRVSSISTGAGTRASREACKCMILIRSMSLFTRQR